MLSTLVSSVFSPSASSKRPEVTRESSAESIRSTITVDAAASNDQSSSSTPPTSIGDSASVSSASLKLEPSQGTPASARSRRARQEVTTYNVKKLAGTACHVPRKYLKNADGTPLPPKPRRRRTISGDTLVGGLASASSSTDTVQKNADRLVKDGIDALDMNWSMKALPRSKSLINLSGSPRKTAKDRAQGSRFKKPEVLGAFGKRLGSVLGKRKQRDRDDGLATPAIPAGGKMSRELRRLQDTAEFRHEDKVPVKHDVWSNGKLVKPEPRRKRQKVEEPVAEAKPEAEKPIAKKPVGRREKKWLNKGLYAGQENKRNPNKILPLPMWHGQQLIDGGRDFKLPFDVCSPLPPGQPKPDEWRKTSSNRFVGDAASFWKKHDPFDSYSSQCVCTSESGCDERCQNRIMLYECNEQNCAVGRHCTNRAFADLQERRKGGGKYRIGVEVMKTFDRGYGVRSNRCFEANQIIVEYTGEIITEEECDRRMNEDYKNNECYYLMSFDQNMILDGTKGSIARFVNHSCKPNCRMVKWLVNGKPRMALFAGDHPIMTGDELTYDYNFDPFSAKNVQECRCGSDNCRGVLGPKPKEVKAVKEFVTEAAVKAFKAGKRKLTQLLGADDDKENQRSPKKRKIASPKGVKRTISSARVQMAKGAAKAVKRRVSTQLLSTRKSVAPKRSGARVVAVKKKVKVSAVKTYGKGRTKANASSRNSSVTIVASEKSPKSVKTLKSPKSPKSRASLKSPKGSPKSSKSVSDSPPPKMSSIGKRSAKKKIISSFYDDRSGTPTRETGEATIRVVAAADSDGEWNP